jgi:hypothetical protein
VTREWRKLHIEELRNLYSSPDIIRQIKSSRMRLGTCGTYGRGEESVRGFGGKTRRKENTLRPRNRWEDGIRMDLGRLGGGGGGV